MLYVNIVNVAERITFSQRVYSIRGVLNGYVTDYGASGIWAMFSGGDDSLAAVLITSRTEHFRGCVHIDTGIGIAETQDFVRETCREQGWPLLVYRAVDHGQVYADLAIRYGFPGPGQHFRMYSRLKERALRQFIREHKQHRKDRLILSTGARTSESDRRMGYVGPVRRDGVKVWANPIHNWDKIDCLDYITERGVRRNPVVELLHMSGECLCGSFAKPGELAEIACWYPETAHHIRALEAQVAAAGRPSVWGQRPGKVRGRVSELCTSCEGGRG